MSSNGVLWIEGVSGPRGILWRSRGMWKPSYGIRHRDPFDYLRNDQDKLGWVEILCTDTLLVRRSKLKNLYQIFIRPEALE